jgi:hypothetical protein
MNAKEERQEEKKYMNAETPRRGEQKGSNTGEKRQLILL